MSTQYGSTDSGSKSPEEVQREVRESRAEVKEGLEAIKDRLSPGQLFDQALDYLRSNSGTDFMRNLGIAIRDNPIPVVLVGIGMAWLMLSGARSRPRGYYEDELLDAHAGAGAYPEEYKDDAVGEPLRSDEHLSGGRAFTERAKRTAEAARRKAEQLRVRAEASAALREADRQELSPEGGREAIPATAESVQRKTERGAEAATEAAKSEAERQNLNKTGSKRA
jgi:hypothetical protein